MLTQEQIEKYLQGGGSHCPYCGSADITAGSQESEGNTSWFDVTCEVCSKSWRDVYTLTSIEEIE